MNERRCLHCNGLIPPPTYKMKGDQRKYCSNECRDQQYQAKYRENNPLMGTSSGTTGAISELRVAIDLLSKGYDIFRAVSPNCSCDLAVLKNSKLLRIEVKTAHKSISGGLYNQPIAMGKNKDKRDIMAWVLPDEIVYEPSLDTF